MSFMKAQNKEEQLSRVYGGNMSNTKDNVSSRHPNTEKRVGNTTRSGVFLSKFETFG